jgi:two-component system chemotaxis response regulator CheB
MKLVRVMVVDDSAFMRQTLKMMIEEDPVLQVVTTARDGRDALIKLKKYHPDVVTLDIIMNGEMDGLETLHHIMKQDPTPVIMVSGASDEHVNYVIEAISSGAFDFINKPSGKADMESIGAKLQLKIHQAALSRIRPSSSDQHTTKSDDTNLFFPSPGGNNPPSLIVICTSTGGPKALQTVIPALKKELSVPIIIIQHMPPRFTKTLAERLNSLSEVQVTEAADGEILQNGRVYIAPGGHHLIIKKNPDALCFQLLDTPAVHGVKPAADVTLESLTHIPDLSVLVAVLTGMGKDGASGIMQLKESVQQVYVVAESEETSVVFGMPKAAIKTHLVDEVCGIDHVAASICRQFALKEG